MHFDESCRCFVYYQLIYNFIQFLLTNLMSLNLDKLVTSQSSYDILIKQSLDIIKRDKDIQSTLKKIILFCKYAFSVNYAQRKKYLCLCLIKDISDKINSNYFDKILDQNIPIKLLKTISNQHANKLKQSRHQGIIIITKDDQSQYSDKLLRFAIQTINFWAKKLSVLPGKSQFSVALDELKKNNKIQIPKSYEFYKLQKLSLGLWGQKAQNEQQFMKNSQISPLINQLFDKFNQCKSLIEQKINQAVLNDQQLYLKPLIQKLRDFLFIFFSKYKSLEADSSIDRDQLVVYFHIINTLFKRICNRFYISVQEMINTTKEVFQANHNAEFSSIDRMDIINLAGIHKYNAINIFQRIKQKIQTQEAKLGPCQLTFEQKDILVYANQKTVANNTPKAGKQMQDRRSPRFKR